MLIACIRELAAQIFFFKYWTKANPMLSQPEAVGLTQPEVNERRQQGQVNLVEKFTTRTVSGILRNNVLTVFNGILTASVVALLAVGANSDAVFLSIVTLANMLVGVISEFRAKWALDRLALLQRHVVTVRRDSHDQEIPSDEVVKDDLVRLTPGDQVIADGMLAPSAPVVMDESLLTGEATAVEKRTGDTVLSGSYCVSGAGYYVATHIGAASSVNTLTAQAKAYKIQLTPTQKSINTLIKTLTAILILFVALLLMAAYIKSLPVKETILSLVTVIKALVPEGLVLISTLAFARDVTLKILSGDNPDTVSAVARQAGITLHGSTISGPELAALAPDAFAKAVHEGQFFGRLIPQQKQQIVKCLQKSGDFVGMVGDGVNDVLALKQADIGIAMNSGAAAARDVSDIVLLKDSFAHLPTLSQEGDRIIHSIKRIMQLFLTKNVYSLFFVGFVGFVGLRFPLSPRDITWIDVLTIGMPATVLTLLAPAVGKQSTENFLREPLKFALLAGLCTAFFSLLVYANFFLFQDRAEQYSRTAGVSVIVLMGLYVLFRLTSDERGPTASVAQRLAVWGLLIGAPLLHGAAVYWPPLRDVLGMVSLDADSWITILAASGLGGVTLHYLLQDAIRKRFFGI